MEGEETPDPVKATRKTRLESSATVYSVLTPAQWVVLMVESLKGASDKDLADKFGVTPNTIRQRRYNDPAWRVAHDRLKELADIGAGNALEKASSAPLSLAEVASANPELVANFALQSLKTSIEQGLIPLPTSWNEAKTAFDMLRKATGQDRDGAQISVSLWSGQAPAQTSGPSVIMEAEVIQPKTDVDWV